LAHFVICIVRLTTSSNIEQFSFFHGQNQQKIYNKINNTITTDPTAPLVCRYNTLWNEISVS